jgi:hypothetical protein
MKVGGFLPRVPKNDPPQGRTEFKNLTDLLQYIIDEDEKAKAEKKALKINSISNNSLIVENSSSSQRGNHEKSE